MMGVFLTVFFLWFLFECYCEHDPEFDAKDWIHPPEFHEERNGSIGEHKAFMKASMWMNLDE